MHSADRFLSILRKKRKQRRRESESVDDALPKSLEEELYELFHRSVDQVPEEMSAAVFEEFFLERARNASDLEEVFDTAQLLAPVIELLGLNYDDEGDPLDSDSWSRLGGIVSDYAHELDMDLVNYVMQRVVEHRGSDF